MIGFKATIVTNTPAFGGGTCLPRVSHGVVLECFYDSTGKTDKGIQDTHIFLVEEKQT